MGSVGKFYNLYGYNNQDSTDKENLLNDKLLNVNPNNLSEIASDIVDLLQILPLNKYSCNFYESKIENLESGFNYYNLVFPLYDSSQTTEKDLYDHFKLEFESIIKERGNYLPPNILDYSAINFYDGHEKHILATKHTDQLNKRRVDFYKDALNKGLRPPVIVNTGIDEYGFSNSFLLDGHHKAKAYFDLKINPAIIEIVGEMYETKDLINDLRQITKTLYKEQLIFLIKQNYEFEEAMKQICSDEVLSEFCLNGEIKDYYPNGKLRQQVKYIQSKRDGIFCWYFPDGTLEKQEKYELGRYKCTYEKYFHNGSLLIKGNEKGILEQYDIYGNKIK
ncbi:MAG: hypothetical protein NXI23_22050 [Bacteroidetes bacterium]|nr:hypothetical protein [Bacteroidota bacterium]